MKKSRTLPCRHVHVLNFTCMHGTIGATVILNVQIEAVATSAAVRFLLTTDRYGIETPGCMWSFVCKNYLLHRLQHACMCLEMR